MFNNNIRKLIKKNNLIFYKLFGLVFFIICILVILSLILYSIDNTLLYDNENQKKFTNILINNYLIIVTFLLNYFGFFAYLTPFILLFISISLFKNIVYYILIIQIITILLLFLHLATLFSLFDFYSYSNVYSIGGLIGDFCANYLHSVMLLRYAITVILLGILVSIVLIFKVFYLIKKLNSNIDILKKLPVFLYSLVVK